MLQARNAQSPEYYLKADCPLEGEKIEARWGGKGARIMGLQEFGELQFLRLAKGLNPETGRKLTARLKENRQDATDYCVTVPKEISVLIEVAHDERVKAALWAANAYAMELVEKKAKARVRKGGAQTDRETGNIAFASFYHATTRPIHEKRDPSHAHFQSNGVEILSAAANDNRATPDPHSHIHNFVFNLTLDKTEDMWKAMKRHRFDLSEIEARFNKRFARELRKLGYDAKIKKTARATSLELHGMDEKVVEMFSRRQGEIKVEEASKPYLHADGNKTFRKKLEAAKAQLSQVVRQSKDVAVEMTKPELRRHWIGRMSDAERRGLSSLVNRSRLGNSLDKWHKGLSRHAATLRELAVSQESTPRGHDRERNNGGWSR